MVVQNYSLFPHLPVARNVAFGLLARKMPRALIEERIDECLRLVGMADFKHRFPRELSGGQQQRVAIARALCMQPKIMLFDEPTSSLDPEMVKEVLDTMVALAQDGMTMLVVSHEMGFARDIARRVCFLEEGRIIEDAPPAELFTSPKDERTQRFLRRIVDAGRL